MEKCCELDTNNDGDCPVHPPDAKLRLVVGDYRCVAPGANNPNGRVYINGGLVIEKRKKNAMGEESWVEVGVIRKPGSPYNSATALEINFELHLAMYYLLGGSVH